MSDNWIVGNLQSAFHTWNDKLAEIWALITTTPQEFRGGGIWTAIVNINDGLQAVGYGLLVLFFAMGIFQSAASFRDFQRPEFALRHFIRFILAKTAIGYGMELMLAIFNICGGIVQSIMGGVGGMASAAVSVPQEMVDTIESIGFLESIPLWLVTVLGSLFITILSFILIMTVYLAEHGITAGTGEGRYSPDAPITVRQWAVMLCRAYDKSEALASKGEFGAACLTEAYSSGWLSAEALTAPDTQMCRGAFFSERLFGGRPACL